MSTVRGTAPVSERADRAAARLAPDLSRSRATQLIAAGGLVVDGTVVTKASARVVKGAKLALEIPPPVEPGTVPEDLPIRIVFEDEHIAVIDKAAGMVVHPGAGHPNGTLVNALLHHLDGLSGIGGVARPGIVHRLDKGTSGLLVVAKHDAAHQHLSAQFAAHTAGRIYLALCHGELAGEGTITSTLGRHPVHRVRFASRPEGRRAVTHWQSLGATLGISLVRCQLETGRTHQIRVHLREHGHPLIGDGLYERRGDRCPPPLAGLVDPTGSRPLLHAAQLFLDHPDTGARMGFTAPLPSDFCTALQQVQLPMPAPGVDRHAVAKGVVPRP